MKKLSFFNRLVYYLTIIFSLALLVACIVPYTDSASLAFFSLAVPTLICINIIFMFYWLFKKKFLMLLSTSVLLYGYITFGAFVKLGTNATTVTKTPTLGLMSYNSQGFHGIRGESQSDVDQDIIEFISLENPDILCFQEFDHKKVRTDNFDAYPHRFVDYEFGAPRVRVIQAIYSKYRIIDNGILEFPSSGNSAMFADVIVKKDTLRIYNLHLESLKIRPGNIKKERSDKLLGRLRKSFQKQQQQSDIVRAHMDASPYRNIVCGDFNNNQFSSVYFNLKRDLKDTFMEKGSGYGATIDFWKFPFRIDFILVDPSFEVVSHQNYDIDLSDHEPIMASIKITPNK